MIEHGLAGFQTQLPANQIELVALRVLEALVPVVKIGAGVDHLAIEPERIELIRRVVVMVDVGLVLDELMPARPVGLDRFERPRAAARHEQEAPEDVEHQALVERLDEQLGLYLRSPRDEVEERAVVQVNAPGRV